MQIEYKRDLNHSYMIVKEEKEPDIASYQIRMLQTNSIERLLACRMHKMNTHMLYYYNVSSMQSIRTLYDHQKISCQALRILFGQMIEVMEELESYLLDPEGLVLTPDTVYFSMEPLKAEFCYLPGSKLAIREQMRELMEYLLPKMNHEEAETVVLGYGLYKEVSGDRWSVNGMKSLLARKIEVPQQTEYFAEEKQEAEEEMEDMRRKAMESFFEAEEEESENPVWTVAAVLGGIAVLGVVFYLMYVTGVPMVMYLIMLAAAGISALVLSLWIRRKEQEDTEKEMETFLIPGKNAAENFSGAGRKEQSERGKPVENAEKEPGGWEKADKSRRESDKGVKSGGEILRNESVGGELRLFRRKKEFSEEKAEKSDQKKNGTFLWEEKEGYEEWGLEDEQKEHSDGEWKEEGMEPADAQAYWKKKQVSTQQLYQKTEPLYRCPGKAEFRLIPISHEGLPTITLIGEETTVGKLGAVVDVVLPFPTVSRLHARLQCTEGRCLVTDLNSCNGTYVNEVQLKGETPYQLEDGDELSFADIKYQLLKA